MQVGDLIKHKRRNLSTISIVLFVGEESIEVFNPSSQTKMWIHGLNLEKQ